MGPFVRLLARSCMSGLATVFLASLVAIAALPSSAQDTSTTGGASAAGVNASDGIVSIGGEVVMRLRSSAGGLSTAQRVDTIEDRLTKIVAVPDIKTSDVILYLVAGKPPVIYVLGRRLITVDAATVKAAGGGNAKQLAVQWAKRLQQILPRVDIRLPNEPEPNVAPNPPLKITSDLTQVEGNVGNVVLRGKTVMRFRGIQPGNVTAAERADMMSDRLNRLANKLDTTSPDAVTVVSAGNTSQTATALSNSAPTAVPAAATAADSKPQHDAVKTGNPNGPVELMMGGKLVYTVTKADTKVAGGTTPQALAESWAKNIRVALGIPPNGVEPNPPTTAQASPTPGTATTPGPATPPPPPAAGVLPTPPPPAPTTPAQPTGPTTPAAPGTPSTPSPGASTPPPATDGPATSPAPSQPATPGTTQPGTTP